MHADQSQPSRIAVRERPHRLDIAIARPDRRNALDYETWDALADAMRTVADRDDVHVVTLTGEGDTFCAGVDFEAIGSSVATERREYPSFIRRWAGVPDAFERVAQPTIAVINGPAVGGGFELALACDIRIASDRAVFCLPQMRMGIVPDVGGTSRLSRAAGEAFAKDMVLTGRVIDAQEALSAGIVSRVVPHAELAATADEMADVIAQTPWPAPYFATVAIDSGPRLDPRRAADLEAIADQVMFRQDEVSSRVEAFMAGKGLKGVAAT